MDYVQRDGFCGSPLRRKCHYCGETTDLRPYGPRGAWVCFDCAMSTPEREAETGRNFLMQLDAAGPVAMLDGTEVGPYPAQHHPDIAALMNKGGI